MVNALEDEKKVLYLSSTKPNIFALLNFKVKIIFMTKKIN